MGGMLNAKTYVDQKTKLSTTTYDQGGYTRLYFNGKLINYYYDPNYDVAESPLDVEIRTYEGYANIGIER